MTASVEFQGHSGWTCVPALTKFSWFRSRNAGIAKTEIPNANTTKAAIAVTTRVEVRCIGDWGSGKVGPFFARE